jgi:hypothetical protein
MAFADRVAAASATARPPLRACHTCWLLDQVLDARGVEERDALVVMIADKGRWPGPLLVQEIVDEFGYALSLSSLRAHRRGECVGAVE